MCVKEIIMQCKVLFDLNNVYSGLFLYVCHDESAVFFSSTTHMNTTIYKTLDTYHQCRKLIFWLVRGM